MTNAIRLMSDSRRSIRDRMRIDTYLMRLEWHLEGIMRGAERKTTIASLRQELLTDPRDLASSLADLGPASVLAARYGDEGERRPLWSIGVIIGAIVLLVYWGLFFAFTGGMLAAVDSAAPAEAHSTFLFVGVEAFSNAEMIGIGWAGGWAWLVVPATIVLAAFLLGARIWRGFSRG